MSPKLFPSEVLNPLMLFFNVVKFSSVSSTYFFTLANAASSSMASLIGKPIAAEFAIAPRFEVSSLKSSFLADFICTDRLESLALSRLVTAFLACEILLFKPSNPFFNSEI